MEMDKLVILTFLIWMAVVIGLIGIEIFLHDLTFAPLVIIVIIVGALAIITIMICSIIMDRR